MDDKLKETQSNMVEKMSSGLEQQSVVIEKQPSLVSVCIITKNEKELLEKCLKSFRIWGMI